MHRYSLSWDDYKSNICGGFSSLQQNGEFVDMTLAADGHFVKVHQLVIALSSSYLKELIRATQCPHPVLLLNNISYRTLCLLLEYIYTGEVIVDADYLSEFTEAAKSLHIKGLESSVQFERPQEFPDLDHKMNTASIYNNSIIRVVPHKSLPTILRTRVNEDNLKRKQDSELISRSKRVLMNENLHNFNVMDVREDTGIQDYKDLSEHIYHDDVLKKESSSTQPNPTPKKCFGDIQYTVSIRGNVQLILNRYIYNLVCGRRKGLRRWRCVEYRDKKCDAMLITKDNMVMRRSNLHNHHFHDKKILNKIENNMIFAKLEDIKTDNKDSPTKINYGNKHIDNLKYTDDDDDD